MNVYKGFDKDLKCRGLQYAIGETTTYDGTLSLCNSGLHFCEHPLDTFTFYPPASSRYAAVDADGVMDGEKNAGKYVAKSLHVQAEVKILELINAAVKFVFQKVKPSEDNYAHSATTGNSACSATTGYYACSATTGYSAHSATTGDSAHSATTGNYAHSATTGDYACSATTGYSAHSATTGDSAHSATTGDSAHSATTGNSARASAMGKQSIAASLGSNGMAKGPKGGWLVLSEIGDDLKIKAVGVARVDGKKIKADTYYQIKGGKFVEVKS
jgi:hypothetical protein